MKRSYVRLGMIILVIGILFTGCGSNDTYGLDEKNPVTLTMWHNFGGDMQSMMDSLIDEFNATVGKEKGIIINVTAISSSSELQNKLNMIANGDPGAPQMPDITTCYPKTAILFQEKGKLANLTNYFSEEELSAYVPSFLNEGRFADGLYVFPIAKSTEVLYVNKTLFDRFASANNITMDCFKTFEGIADAARKYYDWTDAKTPETKGDGKQFFSSDSWLNFAQVGMKQQGKELFVDHKLNLNNNEYKKIWDCVFTPAVSGGFAMYDGYSSDLSKTGDLVCSTGSSAGILFYGDTITYADNTVEKVTYNILPYPVFEGGKNVAIQRGNGMCVAASDKTREYAASVFLKWFTEPTQNRKLTTSTGYLPVTNEAFEQNKDISSIQDERIKMMLTAVTNMHTNYEFFVSPLFDEFDTISKKYETDFKQAMRSGTQLSDFRNVHN